MFDVKINITLVIVEVLLVICGILFWFSDKFSHELGVIGFFPRLLAGAVAIAVAVILYLLTNKND